MCLFEFKILVAVQQHFRARKDKVQDWQKRFPDARAFLQAEIIFTFISRVMDEHQQAMWEWWHEMKMRQRDEETIDIWEIKAGGC